MKAKVIVFLALFFLMLITGVFWGTWFTMTRTIEDFAASEFIHIGKVIIANVAMPMRIIVPGGILFLLLSLWLNRKPVSSGLYFGFGSLALILVVLMITLFILVPIDNQINRWTAENIPRNWEDIRATWKAWHAFRTFASLAAFTCFSVFVMGNETSRPA